MSAGFRVGGEVFWGTNGAVEAYLEALADLAAARLGLDDPLAAFLREERDVFQAGRVVPLDGWLAAPAGRALLEGLLDGAADRLLREGVFSEYGREWVATVVSALRARVAEGGPG
jgi:hypothetical protein